MKPIDYKTFYERVGARNGWDFSKVKCFVEGEQPLFYDEVAKRCRQTDRLLDLGTGGGEALLTIAGAASQLTGIDQSAAMIAAAKRNAARAGAANVEFLQMDSAQLDFPAGHFHLASCRHSVFYPKELAKVLTAGGIFLTQQVGERDKINLKDAFKRGQAYGTEPGHLKNRCIAELVQAGFTAIEAFEFDFTEYYETAEDLIFLLKHTPIIPNFGDREADFRILRQFIAEYETDKGIKTNSHRFVLIAKWQGHTITTRVEK